MINRYLNLLFKIIGIILFFFFSNCNVQDDAIIQLHPPTFSDPLIGCDRPISESLLIPRQMTNVDDQYLIVMENRQDEIFKVFSLPELNHLYSWGRRGEGPDAFQSISFNFLDSTENLLIVYLPALRTLQYFEVTDSSLVSKDLIEIGYPGQTEPLNDLVRVHDQLFIASISPLNASNREFIALQPGHNRIVNEFGSFPSTNLELNERFQRYSKISTANHEENLFASYYLHHNRLRIYNLDGDLLRDVSIDNPNIPGHAINDDLFIFRSNIVESTGEYIYTMGIHSTITEIESYPENFRPSLEIWNWMGEPVASYMFEKPLFTFTLSEKYGKIYSLSYLEDNIITVYDLPDI